MDDFEVDEMEEGMDGNPFDENFKPNEDRFYPEGTTLEDMGFLEVPMEEDPFEHNADISPEVLSSLEKMGYTSKEEVTSDWRAHFMKVRECSHGINWRNLEEGKKFIEEIPVYNNILSPENAEKDHIVLLGEILNKQKDEIIRLLDEKKFPVATLKSLIEWYNNYIWNEF